MISRSRLVLSHFSLVCLGLIQRSFLREFCSSEKTAKKRLKVARAFRGGRTRARALHTRAPDTATETEKTRCRSTSWCVKLATRAKARKGDDAGSRPRVRGPSCAIPESTTDERTRTHRRPDDSSRKNPIFGATASMAITTG